MGTIVRTGLIALLVSLSVAASAQKTVNYTVRKGESLYTIAHKHGLRLPEVMAVNPHLRNPHALQPGDIIKLPVKGSAPRGTSSNTSTANGWAIINKDRINIRQQASTNSQRITIVDRGLQVQILARQGEWRRVRLPNGREGWVKADYLSPTTPPKTASAKAPPRKSSAQVAAQRRQPSRSAALAELAGEDTPALIRRAMGYLGAPYRRGGSSARGFDCSGFALHIYRQFGVNLPHSSAAQSQVGKPVARHELQPGDLVFFRTRGRRISHVGIYIGNGKFIHASSSRGRVRIDSLTEGYYNKRYAGARRVAQ